ncbi:isoaspartyl peptidase/L-asparaginase [candidate division KSB1 bacterium]
MKPGIIVHGGAWGIPDDVADDHINGCRNAVLQGYEVLKDGGSAVDAVEKAVIVMENDPTFDAGTGSFLNAVGEVEMDALIMDGRTLKAGAVGAVKNIKNPVSLAKKILEHPDIVFLVGDGAGKYAEYCKIPRVETEELVVGRELERLEEIRNNKEFKVEKIFREIYKGTVGSAAIDINGNLAAATSTGGTPNKIPGRIGDVPIIGAGGYAENGVAAVSATGWGESLLRVVVSKSAADNVKSGSSPEESAKSAIDELEKKVNGNGGLIVIDHHGNIGFHFNTPRMAYAYIDDSGNVQAGV